ncbi:MAG: hypothetical protein M1829_003731 [Trizodia sp. TS-e1964]|nr:MAG: hypothetical protein M1829_003731 [Trizodia sp. TS-e1964]
MDPNTTTSKQPPPSLPRNPHESAAASLREAFKKYQKLDASEVDQQEDIIDLRNSLKGFRKIGAISESEIATIFSNFEGAISTEHQASEKTEPPTDYAVYENDHYTGVVILTYPAFWRLNDPSTGLHILPFIFPPHIQLALLARLIHRDLSDPRHKTNIHAHHTVPYDSNKSFFAFSPSSSQSLAPIDPQSHTSLSIPQFLQKKLRWITLGGQYDWTKKSYPPEEPPPFPSDIARLLQGIFPDMQPQAAIVNIYSPGDTLSLHRDVSEECDQGLISVSFGCDALFIVSREPSEASIQPITSATDNFMVIRLHSGDAVYMSGAARYAWHGVAKIIPGTCPAWMQDWPASANAQAGVTSQYEQWRGWMKTKRVNLNVRQMREVNA